MGSSLSAGYSCYRKSLWAAIKSGKETGRGDLSRREVERDEERGERTRGGNVLIAGAEE